jgi:hypothetical protein
MRPVETQDQSCLSCKFWAGVRPAQQDDNRFVLTGQCRKNAPVVGPAGGTWPATNPNDWCAVYEAGTTPNDAKRFL